MNKASARPPSAPRLQVIQGGLGTAPGGTDLGPGRYIPSSKVTPAEREENRLRSAILRLQVPELGMTIEAILQELSDKVDSEVDADFARLVILRHRVEDFGLRFHLARPEMELAREGYFILAWPERLARLSPEFAALNPEDHPLMAVG